MTRRLLAEIDLAAIRHNIGAIRRLVGPRVAVMPVLKADGYGHGAEEVACASVNAGVEWLGVATVGEGAVLRAILPHSRICLFSPFSLEEAGDVVRHRLIPFTGDERVVRALSREAQCQHADVCIHLEVDTGMGRSGFLPSTVRRLTDLVTQAPALRVTGLMTHFASAEADPDYTRVQLALFAETIRTLQAAGIQFEAVHCAASAAICLYPETHFNLVRPGLLVYGIMPSLPDTAIRPSLRPALALKTRIVMLRDLPEGSSLSYARTHRLRRPARIATLPVGYGDGYPRDLSNQGDVLIQGKRAPVVGRVCMDMTLVDVTDIPDADIGAEVVLIGLQGDEQIKVEEIARRIGTTEHDVTTRLTSRVPRVYLNGS